MTARRNALSDLRQYVRNTLYDDTVPAISFPLPVEDPTPPFDDRDIYDSRLSGADRREVAAAERDQPVADYEPPIWTILNPVTGDREPALGVGHRVGNPTYTMALGGADQNRYILERQAPERRYDRTVPREIVRGVAARLCPDDQQALRGMARLGKADATRARTGAVTSPLVTVKQLAREAGVTRVTMHRRHHEAAKALLDGLYRWHAANPEHRVA